MLEQGYDSYHLRMLAGEIEDREEIFSLADKTFEELGLDCSDTEQAVKLYTYDLLARMLEGAIEQYVVLYELYGIVIELEYPSYIYDFYTLYWALDDLDLKRGEVEFSTHMLAANRSNIKSIIEEVARNWIEAYASP